MLAMIIRSLFPGAASRGLVVALMAMFVLVGCQASLPSQRLPDLTYTHLQPLTFNAGSVEIAMDYRAPLVAPNVDHLFPVPPSDALRQWAGDRLKTTGGDTVVRLVIIDASVVETTLVKEKGLKGVFTKDQSERYEARIEATMEIRDNAGERRGFARTEVRRSTTIREDANINERELAWFKLVESLMQDFDAEMEKNTRRHLQDWLK